MNYEKIRKSLKEMGYLDDRNLMCHSNANMTEVSPLVFVYKVKTISQSKLPRFMILSLNGNILHISKAKLFGGFKEYFGSIDISKLQYVRYEDNYVDTYEFDLIINDNEKSKFYINASSIDDNLHYAYQLVEAIKEYNKKEEA